MKAVIILSAVAALSGCGTGDLIEDDSEDVVSSHVLNVKKGAGGETLFKKKTFGGNGRTCSTCHGDATGTITPAEVAARFAAHPKDPLFRPIDSDLGLGLSYTRLIKDATFRLRLPLPPNVVMQDNPTATHVVVNRSTPSTLNTPALDPTLMWDGRAPDLEAQALGAVITHFEPKVLPPPSQLSLIAEYEETLFSSPALKAFAEGGPPPELPAGVTQSEKRGRTFFLPAVFAPPSKVGACGTCHAGPMLNEISPGFPVASGIPCPIPDLGEPCTNSQNPPRPVGSHFMTAFVSELNEGNNPLHLFVFTNPDGSTTPVLSPDVGLALITGDARDAQLFKIPTLWNVKNTAPYFHDNSAKTLEDLAEHYRKFIAIAFFGTILLDEQDKADIVAFLKLL